MVFTKKTEYKIFGTLKIFSGSIQKLELLGTFDTLDELKFFLERKIILGKVAQGTEITLLNNRKIEHNISGKGMHSSTYLPE